MRGQAAAQVTRFLPAGKSSQRIAVSEQQGQKVFTLQTLPASDNESNEAQIGQIAGFSLHAGIMAR